jgi:hypothetical protein
MLYPVGARLNAIPAGKHTTETPPETAVQASDPHVKLIARRANIFAEWSGWKFSRSERRVRDPKFKHGRRGSDLFLMSEIWKNANPQNWAWNFGNQERPG